MSSETLSALIVAAHGRHYQVMLADGSRLFCYSRGKKSEAVCGDWVEVRPTGDGGGVIENIAPRRNLFYRSNAFRQKLIAANVDQILLVAAVVPAFSGELIERCRIAASHQGMNCLILLNKCDLTDTLSAAREYLRKLAVGEAEILEISALDTQAVADKLLPSLRGKTSLLVGQSGMGKSTLINALVPEAKAGTGEISLALDSGKHTTTAARLYFLPDALSDNKAGATLAEKSANGCLIDSPGLQAFGLGHIPFAELEASFPEFRPFLGQCRFRDCRHQQEPGCALVEAVEKNNFPPERLRLFRVLSHEIQERKA